VDPLGLGMGMGGGGGGRGFHSVELQDAARHEHFDTALLLRALRTFRPYLWPSIATLGLILVTTGLGSVSPIFVSRIIDRGITPRHIGPVIRYAALMLAASGISGLLGVVQTYLTTLVGQSVMADYRQALFEHLHRQPMSFFTQTQSGQLVSRVTNDVAAIQNVVTTTFVGVISNVLTIATTLVVMFVLDWRLAVLSLVVVPAFVIPTRRVGRTRQDVQRRIQVTLATLTTQLTETLGISGALLVKAFTGEKSEAKRFAASNQDLNRLQVRRALIGRWLFMWLGLFGAVGPALLYGYGGWLAVYRGLEVGTIVAFTQLLGRLYNPMSGLAQLQVSVLTSVALFRRIYELLDRVPEVQDGPLVLAPETARGEVALDGVAFSYSPDGPLVLADVSLEILPGQMVALVGPSGAGKSSLMNLVPRFADPVAGRVLVDGRDARQYTLESLRACMGLVPQEPFLFHDTVATNLRYARPDATDAELEAACRAAQIHDVIAAMPDGYETMVGERGHRLSGGEKQRMAIARVLLRAPRLVLLDEATSSLDTLSERRIQAALETLLAGRAALVIAHRLSTVLAADRIIVLDKGRVVASGRHGELLAAGGLYRRLYDEQFNPGGGIGGTAPA
jgi:ATP-binding cassette subfamily B protein